MASHISQEMVDLVEPLGDSAVSPSADRIKALALEKRREFLMEKEEKPMKKTIFRIVLVAALVCAMGATVFAAFGGLDLIKGIFGDSAESIQGEIVIPRVSASAGGRDMALEALVTDGFVTNMVVSLTGERPPEQALFQIETDMALRSNGWYVLEDFSAPGKTCYVVDFVSEQRFDTADITLSLNRDIAPIDLTMRVENTLGNAVVQFPQSAMAGQTQLGELQISPMGFLLIGHESDAQGGLPSTGIRLVFSDGGSEDIEVEFAPSDETVGGGGGAILVDEGQAAPLVTTFQGARNPDGELVINGQFSRVIHPEKIEKVIVGGVEYPAQTR